MPLPSSRLPGERMAKTRRSRRAISRGRGCTPTRRFRARIPIATSPAVEADEGVVLLHEGRSGLGSETSNGSDESESSFVDDASGSRESDGSPVCVLGAQESATALGTAFHRLAQQAIERSERGSLFAPSEEAIRAQIQKEGLSEEQQARLRAALVRWLGSDEAALLRRFRESSRRSALHCGDRGLLP